MPERVRRAADSVRQDHDDAAVNRTAPIDPVISEPPTDTSMIPVVRPSETEPEPRDEGFMKNLTGSIAASWASAGEEAYLEWEEYDVEAAARAEQEAEAEEAESTRHTYTDDFSLSDAAEPPAATSAVPIIEQPGMSGVPQPSSATGAIGLPITGPSSPIPQVSPSEPMRRRSVLRPSWLRPKSKSGGKASAILNRTVFDRRVNPQYVFNKIMQTEQPKTGQQSIIDRLQGTPFQHTVQGELHEGMDELETMSFVLDLGEALFRYGAGALEVETSIIAVTAAFGMKNTDVDITNQSISLNWAPESKVPYSRVRVVRSWSQNFHALSGVHRLVADVTAGRLTRTEAEAELKDITRQPKPYPRWMVTLCAALFASLFASYLGAPILDAAAGFAATLLVMWTSRTLTTWRIPEFFALGAGGFAASAFAMIAFGLDADITPSMVTAGGLMILLPSVRIVGAIQDAINGFPMTAAGRLVSVLIAFAGMTSGIMAAVVGADLLGIVQTELAQGLTRIYPAPALIILVFFAGCTAAVVEQTRPGLILPTGSVAALGFCALYLGELIGLGDRFTPVIGGFVVGALGRVVALRLGAPQLVVAVPAMMFMLPGLMVFRGMYQIAIEDSAGSMMGGLFELFNALIIVMAITAGIVLGDVVMRRFTTKMHSNERANARRR